MGRSISLSFEIFVGELNLRLHIAPHWLNLRKHLAGRWRNRLFNSGLTLVLRLYISSQIRYLNANIKGHTFCMIFFNLRSKY